MKSPRWLGRLWPDPGSEPVWYVSYGSNMSGERFLCYVQGGQAAGASFPLKGCTDRSLPERSVPLRLGRKLYFAGHSKTWDGGGVALLDHDEVDGDEEALGRGWLIRRDQLNDIVTQENGPSVAGVEVDVDRVVEEGTLALGQGRYQTMLYLGERDGHPMVTFTAPWTLDDVERGEAPVALNGPSADYRNMIAQGLEETHGLSSDEALDYLDDVTGAFDFEEAPEGFFDPPPAQAQVRSLLDYRQEGRSPADGMVKRHRRQLASGRTTQVKGHRRSRR